MSCMKHFIPSKNKKKRKPRQTERRDSEATNTRRIAKLFLHRKAAWIIQQQYAETNKMRNCSTQTVTNLMLVLVSHWHRIICTRQKPVCFCVDGEFFRSERRGNDNEKQRKTETTRNVREKDENYKKFKYLLVKKPRGRSMTQNKRPKEQIIM